MGESSVTSEFQFKSFKVDRFLFTSQPKVNLLARVDGFRPDEWDIKFRFRNPMYFQKLKAYVGGLDILVFVRDPEKESEEGEAVSEETALVSLDTGIGGVFTVSGRFDKNTEESLAKVQIPALLLPYLRGTITSFLANAGFGTLIFPLINIHAAAADALKSVEVKIIED